jgi:hypothetical protein
VALHTTYATDNNLAVYVDDVNQLPTLTTLHTAAGTQINEDLRAAGWDVRTDGTDPLGDLSDATLAQLIKPACLYVLWLIYSRYSDSGMVARADSYLKEYRKALGQVRVAEDANADGLDDAPGKMSSGWVGR